MSMIQAFKSPAAKMLRKVAAWSKGKKVKVTIPNFRLNEAQMKKTNQPFITLTGFEMWGDPKAQPKPLKSK